MLTRHTNSFDLLRIIFSFFVIITHSHSLTGISDDDFISKNTNNHYHFSTIGVYGFFTISGYFVVQSLNNTNNLHKFLLKRFFRIYPGLITVLLLTVGLGWIVYSGTFQEYIHDRNIYTYFFKNLLLIKKPFIFGIFDNNPAGNVINVSLWTLPYEVALYCSVTSFLLIPKNSQYYAAIIIQLLAILILLISTHYAQVASVHIGALVLPKMMDTAIYFYGGVFLGTLPQRFINKPLFILISLIVILLTAYFPLPPVLFNLSLPFFVIGFGNFNSPTWISKAIYKIGDISFGVYIYAFPVQQTLVYYFELNFWQLLILTGAISTFFGYLSWHFIEKRALLYARKRV